MKKRIIFLLILFTGSITLNAQDWEYYNKKAMGFYNARNIDSAIVYGQKAVNTAAKDQGKTHLTYASCLINLAFLYSAIDQYNEAIPLYIEALQVWKDKIGEDNQRYATTLQNLADIYYYVGKYDDAELSSLKALAIRKKVLGPLHGDYAMSLNNLAIVYSYTGKYKKAEVLMIEATGITKQTAGEYSEDYAIDLNNLAVLYRKMGNYEKAKPLLLRVAEIRKQVVKELHPDYALSLNSLATFYSETGEYEEAIRLATRAIEIMEQITTEKPADYGVVLNNTALLYSDMGLYEKAEPLFLKAGAIWKQSLGPTHHQYSISLHNLGLLYKAMGLYAKAEVLILEALDISKKTLGDKHPGYASGLVTLGALYDETARKDKALSLYIQAAEIDKEVYGEEHPSYANSLSHIASSFLEEKDFASAESLYLRARDIYIKYLGEEHPSVARNYSSLALINELTGKIPLAETYFLKAKQIQEKTLGTSHPDYSITLNELARIYIKKGQFAKAEKFKIDNSKVHLQNLMNNFTVLTEKEKGTYIAENSTLLESNNSFLFLNSKKLSPAFAGNNFDLQLAFKSFSLSDTKELLNFLRSNKDTSLGKIFNEWFNNRQLLAKQFALPKDERLAELDSIMIITEQQEKTLATLSSGFRAQQKSVRVSMEDIQQKLKTNEVAIEFVRFYLYTDHWTDTVLYAAYVLSKSDKYPQFVYLCREDQLGKFFSPSGGNANIKSLYRSEVIDDEGMAGISGDSLYALVWKPLEPYIKAAKKISIAPAGMLNRIAFHALPAGPNMLLIDKYELEQYISIRQMNESASPISTKRDIVLFGDCLFSDSTVATSNSNTTVLNLLPSTGTRGGAGWTALPGTAEEVNSIQNLFEKNKVSSKAFTKSNASEEQFKSLNGQSPYILHLATHGFFLPDVQRLKTASADSKQNAFVLAEDPLMRSGIVLAGANKVWKGGSPTAGREDGVVTAYEIAQLDLSNTELVVLSACETALGDIKGNEGVFGLQRAFKLAGVRNLLLSLWKVPDAETAELMRYFYNYFIQGKSIREAFTFAQRDMRAKYSPYYWAAFVLIE